MFWIRPADTIFRAQERNSCSRLGKEKRQKQITRQLFWRRSGKPENEGRRNCNEEARGPGAACLLSASALCPGEREGSAQRILQRIERDPGHAGQGNSTWPAREVGVCRGLPIGEERGVHRGRELWQGSDHLSVGRGIPRTLERSGDVCTGRWERRPANWKRDNRFRDFDHE